MTDRWHYLTVKICRLSNDSRRKSLCVYVIFPNDLLFLLFNYWCMYVHICMGAYEGQKSVLGGLLELQS